MAEQTLPVVEIARAQLADELACPPDQIDLVSAEAVDWSDSSLGCPQPGMMYMQVITPGFRVTLTHAGQQYTYHTDQGRRVVRCTTGQRASDRVRRK